MQPGNVRYNNVGQCNIQIARYFSLKFNCLRDRYATEPLNVASAPTKRAIVAAYLLSPFSENDRPDLPLVGDHVQVRNVRGGRHKIYIHLLNRLTRTPPKVSGIQACLRPDAPALYISHAEFFDLAAKCTTADEFFQQQPYYTLSSDIPLPSIEVAGFGEDDELQRSLRHSSNDMQDVASEAKFTTPAPENDGEHIEDSRTTF
jgi:hypothetical protein